MSSNIAITVTNLSKCYEIYDNPSDRLKQFVMPRIRRAFGRADRQYFNEFWALNDISFEIKKGESVGIIGRNGSGKSTLLQMICGTLTPTVGSIQVNGRVAALLELGSGFNPEFTGRENIYMNAIVLGLCKEDVDERFEDIVAFADIGDFIEQPVKNYSSGMFMRLAFAIIVYVDADILVIDEALAVGDAAFVQKCMRFLRGFMENGTLLFVSHDSGAIKNLCNNALWLNQGANVLFSDAKSVTERYLAGVYEEQQGLSNNTPDSSVVQNFLPSQGLKRDQRSSIINCSNLRNDIEVFDFVPSVDDESFGTKKLIIESAVIQDENGEELNWIVGGEKVTLVVQVYAYQNIERPLVGFLMKDRLGQPLFGDNTYITYMDKLINFEAEQRAKVFFCFTMPTLPKGDYSITVSTAEGTQYEHVQHHWIHDAIHFVSHSSSVCTGLIGIPMGAIVIEKIHDEQG